MRDTLEAAVGLAFVSVAVVLAIVVGAGGGGIPYAFYLLLRYLGFVP
jgi:hypothetical protein